MIQSKIQIEEKDLEFIRKASKDLSYKSLSQYMREAIQAKIREDRKKLKAIKRTKAMTQIGRTRYENIFESLDGEDFEDR
ncbi:MAG: crotonobetainyl-CoA--carnitine CoA-transferase [Deltaproteobacteria bacterium]|nr:crotonobetainyl-CoA--carnitine CoA-transferase [Deltaproteobacteria bacterium]